jgi:hypothetical protein
MEKIQIKRGPLLLGSFVLPLSLCAEGDLLASWEFSDGTYSQPITGTVSHGAEGSVSVAIGLPLNVNSGQLEVTNSQVRSVVPAFVQFELVNLPVGLTSLGFAALVDRDTGNAPVITSWQLSTQDRSTPGVWSAFVPVSLTLPTEAEQTQVSGLVWNDATDISGLRLQAVLVAGHVAQNARAIGFSEVGFTGQMIPEPSTYALIFGGLVLAGAGWVRRRRSS